MQFMSMRRENGKITVGDLPSKMSRMKIVGEILSEEEREIIIQDMNQNMSDEIDFEFFLRVRGSVQSRLHLKAADAHY